MRVRTLLATTRPPFLLLPPMCVALGLAVGPPAAGSGARAALVLAGALAAHAAVNVLNEWHDARTGLDAHTQRTPFSGGSGALQADPDAQAAALGLGTLLMVATTACGIALLDQLPADAVAALMAIGLAGLVLVVAYTPVLTHWPLACLMAPGLGFGPLMVLGTQAAMRGHIDAAGLVASVLPWAHASGLLLLNQFPDVEADRTVGRRHLPMVWGRPRAAQVFAVLLAAGHGSLLLGVLAGVLPRGAALGLLTLPLAVAVARGALRHADDLPALVPVMGRNVALVLSTPLLTALGCWLWP